MLNIISQNPYRYLGVYSNSPTKELVANQGKIKAFLKVGKQVSFPLDLPDLLPPINRTTESVADATAKLTLPADQMKYAQFWWMKVTNMDDIAFNHLLKGDVDSAKSFWEKKQDATSLQNRTILALIQGDYSTATRCAETLYNSYASSFVSNVVSVGIAMDGTALAHNFIDVLIKEGLAASELQTYITDNEWRSYISEKGIAPLLDSITQAISVAQSSRDKGPKARYDAGKKLMTSTKGTLKELKSLIPSNDIRYTTIVDKLGIEILQCGIDYFNDSNDDDAAHKAMELQNYALSVVVGSLAKERCQENVTILKNIIAQLPPVEVMTEYRAIVNALQRFRKQPNTIANAVSLLNSTKPHLQAMKSMLGVTNKDYLQWSTIVVSNALGAIIAEVNASQENADFTTIYKVHIAVDAAWDATLIMDTFDMENDFKTNNYNPNRATLKGMYDQFNSSGNSYPRTTTTTSTTSSSGDTPWGCIIPIAIGIIIFFISMCSSCQ